MSATRSGMNSASLALAAQGSTGLTWRPSESKAGATQSRRAPGASEAFAVTVFSGAPNFGFGIGFSLDVEARHGQVVVGDRSSNLPKMRARASFDNAFNPSAFSLRHLRKSWSRHKNVRAGALEELSCSPTRVCTCRRGPCRTTTRLWRGPQPSTLSHLEPLRGRPGNHVRCAAGWRPHARCGTTRGLQRKARRPARSCSCMESVVRCAAQGLLTWCKAPRTLAPAVGKPSRPTSPDHLVSQGLHHLASPRLRHSAFPELRRWPPELRRRSSPGLRHLAPLEMWQRGRNSEGLHLWAQR